MKQKRKSNNKKLSIGTEHRITLISAISLIYFIAIICVVIFGKQMKCAFWMSVLSLIISIVSLFVTKKSNYHRICAHIFWLFLIVFILFLAIEVIIPFIYFK